MVERKLLLSELRPARNLFPSGKIGSDICRKALQFRAPLEIIELRREFGEGKSGSQAFFMISSGSVCEAKINDRQCVNVASFTLDFDILASEEHIPVCGTEHELMVRKKITADLRKSIADPTFGINGRGRF